MVRGYGAAWWGLIDAHFGDAKITYRKPCFKNCPGNIISL